MSRNVCRKWLMVLFLLAGIVHAETTVTRPFVGVVCTQRTVTSPRLLNINVVEINLDVAGVSFYVTPGNGDAPGDTSPQTTQNFMVQAGAQMAVNAHFYAASGAGKDLCGLAYSNGRYVSAWANGYPALNISQSNWPTILTSYPSGISLYNAVAGNAMIVTNGVNTAPTNDTFHTYLHPRTAIGISANKRKLVIMTVDGRRAGVSLGVSTKELGNYMLQYGAYNAINLDGGGSTQLAINDSEPRLANVPSESPRSVGSNLAIYATPIHAPAGMTPELIAYEGFDYPRRAVGYDSNLTPTDGGIYTFMGGSGWAGGWKELQKVSGITGDHYAGIATYETSSDISGDRVAPLEYTDSAGRELIAAGAQMRSGFGDCSVTTRYIDTSRIGEDLIKNGQLGADGAEIWISFLAQSYNTSTGDRWSFLQLGPALRLGRISGSDKWGIQDARNLSNTAWGTIGTGTPVMFLAKVIFRNGNDVVKVWLNPRLTRESALPEPDMTMTLADFTFSSVGIIGSYSTDFDELRIGTSFDAVTPAFPGDGDANGDGRVDVGDLGILAAHYGMTSGATWAMGDFNDNGAVNVGDLGVLAANYGYGVSGEINFDADCVKAFGETIETQPAGENAKADEENSADKDNLLDEETSDLTCPASGFALMTVLAIAGLALTGLKETNS